MPVVDCWNFAQHPNVPEKPTMDVQNPVGFLKEKYHPGAFGLDNLKNEGIYRLHGWAYDYRPWMKRFLVKQYNEWNEKWAPDEETLRASYYPNEEIEEVVQIPDKENE